MKRRKPVLHVYILCDGFIVQETGIGKLVNSYRKHGEGIGDRARELVAYWKQLVTEQTEPETTIKVCNTCFYGNNETTQQEVFKSIVELILKQFCCSIRQSETAHETTYDSTMRIPNMQSPPKQASKKKESSSNNLSSEPLHKKAKVSFRYNCESKKSRICTLFPTFNSIF